jgi:hypothetical protein
MPPRTLATFDAAFQDDAEWDEHGLPLVPGGRGVTEALRDALERLGPRCTPLVQHSFYGWRFEFESDGKQFTCIVQSFEDEQWLLICEPRRSVWHKLISRRDDDNVAVGLTAIHEVLTSDSRISNVQWHQREEFEKGGSLGAPTPT